jgi:serine/threonine protein kinase
LIARGIAKNAETITIEQGYEMGRPSLLNVEVRNGVVRLAKIGDFGLAKMRSLAGLSNITRTASGAWGTPAFMSREQARNFKYSGPEVDVWSIAATLYYMLTTEVPRDFGGNLDGFAVVKYREALPIERRRDLPRQLAAVIDAALLETPKMKFQSAATLKVALEDVL